MNSSLLNPTAETDLYQLEEVTLFQNAAGHIQPPERLFKDRFEVIRQLGKGGFGTAYLAQDISAAKPFPCVIKQLKYSSRPAVSQLEKDPSKASLTAERIKRRFQREARMMARLGRHHQLPCLLEHFTEGGRFYLVQEYIPGHTLSREISRSGPQSEQAVKQFLQEMIPIVRYIHRQNLLHLDIKPANIMRRSSDQKLVLIDFGAVRHYASETTSSSVAVQASGKTSGKISGKTSGKTDRSCGTLGFSPKEQLAGTPTTASDIYALGVTCLYLLTKVSPLDLARSPQGQNLRWQEMINVSNHFARLLSKMLHPEADCRFQDTYELERAMNLETYYEDLKTCLTTEPLANKTVTSPKAWQITQPHAAENQSPAQRQADSIRRWQQRRRQFSSFTPS